MVSELTEMIEQIDPSALNAAGGAFETLIDAIATDISKIKRMLGAEDNVNA